MNVTLWFSDKYKYTKAFARSFQLAANRLMVGQFRHAQDDRSAFDHKQNYLKRAKAAIKRYEQTRNTEALLDASNYCHLEFHNPSLPDAQFTAEESQGRRTGVGL